MNKVYYFYGDEDYGGIYIAAESFRKAKELALNTWVCDNIDNPFINLCGQLCGGRKHPVLTEYYGELDILQLAELDLLWWTCNDCGGENLKVFKKDDCDRWVCNDCGYESEVPYL